MKLRKKGEIRRKMIRQRKRKMKKRKMRKRETKKMRKKTNQDHQEVPEVLQAGKMSFLWTKLR